MYISNDNGVSNLYANAESATYAFRDIAFPETTNDFQLSFFWKNEGESDSWESVRVYIGEPENITGGQGDYEGAELANATLLGSFYGNGDYWSIVLRICFWKTKNSLDKQNVSISSFTATVISATTRLQQLMTFPL